MAFVSAMSVSKVTTANGAPSLATTTDPFVDAFFKAVQGVNMGYYHKLISKCTDVDLEKTIRLLLHIRDCREGKGIKHIYYDVLASDTFNSVRNNMLEITPEYGYWKDLLNILEILNNNVTLKINTKFKQLSEYKKVVDMFATQLVKDYCNLKSNKNVSLCAKFTPSKNKHFDKTLNIVNDISYTFSVKSRDISAFDAFDRKKYNTMYRKIVSELRRHLDVAEVKFAENNWYELDFNKMPGLCMKRHVKAFNKNCENKWILYLNDVSENKAKMNNSLVYPYEILSNYINRYKNSHTDAMWSNMVREHKKSNLIGDRKIIPIIDVSPSMTCNKSIPLKNAISLGLLIAELTKETPMGGSYFTFSENPTFNKIDFSKSLYENVRNLRHADWGGSTDFVKVFDYMLSRMVKNKVKAQDAPEIIFCMSDMQFNHASKWDKTTFEILKDKYNESGYKMPKLWFWNLNGNTTDFPVESDEDGTLLLSGFSTSLLKQVLSGEFKTPSDLVNDILYSSRYDIARDIINV